MQTAWTYNNFISGSGKQCLGATQPCFACWGESPIPKINEMCWLRIVKNAPKTIQGSTYNVNTKISAQI